MARERFDTMLNKETKLKLTLLAAIKTKTTGKKVYANDIIEELVGMEWKKQITR